VYVKLRYHDNKVKWLSDLEIYIDYGVKKRMVVAIKNLRLNLNSLSKIVKNLSNPGPKLAPTKKPTTQNPCK